MAADAPYSPRLRTALVLSGAGTAGTYQAGVLRALTEAGVKIDLVAAHGAGVMTALCAAIDGGARLWDPAGPWTRPRLTTAYRWRPALRVAAAGFFLSGLVLLSPVIVLVLAALVYAASLVASLVDLTGASAWLVAMFGRMIEVLFHPPIVPTIVPRAVVLGVVTVFVVLVVAAVTAWRHDGSRRRLRGAIWWRLVGSPLTADEPAATLLDTLWQLVRGASSAPRPAPADVGRRYLDILTENLGQPGFRELMLGVHDLDGRRDVVAAVLGPEARAGFVGRRRGLGPREAETIDWTTGSKELIVDVLTASLRQPVASPPHGVTFAADSYWSGEHHRLTDRPELVGRLVDEVAGVGIEQVILVSAAPPAAVPHRLHSRPLDLRGRLGEVVRSIETAALHDAWAASTTRFSGVFVIRPDHNPVGPFDFAGVYDESSDRRAESADLLGQGYADAYRQFIEPVVAAGDRLHAI